MGRKKQWKEQRLNSGVMGLSLCVAPLFRRWQLVVIVVIVVVVLPTHRRNTNVCCNSDDEPFDIPCTSIVRAFEAEQLLLGARVEEGMVFDLCIVT